MSSAVWFNQVDDLVETFRVITIDLPGHGNSSPTVEEFSIRGCSEAIAGLLDHLGLCGVLLGGWSLGAQIAMDTYTLIRDRMSGLVLIGATPHFTQTENYPFGLSPLEADGMALKVRRNIQRARDGFLTRMFLPGEFQEDLSANSALELLRSIPLPSATVALQSLHALVAADFRDSIRYIDLPTLLLNGDGDEICLPGAAGYIADRLQNCRHITFPGCGHAPFISRPAHFNEHLIEFAERLRGASAR
jgi:pimeloyl-[acyl-carrier protein] methyl ester esterase